MQIANVLSEIDTMVSQGQIVEAVDKFFHAEAQTVDFEGTVTSTKEEMLTKMNGFVGSIQNVNGITLHHSIANDTVSMSEYTFDFDMKDGSHILWHEIIHREWKDGKVIKEQYFKN